ncbi:Hyaluronoglucosaminidase precursor [uncultured Clostridium sp.]|uniref:discoidin domain-containing protein n=1 Tax=uncultured Clostridium sp. TaxID=59620 RepID=UPI000821A921|nr:discoidin domain-containing protein [uncultured Clostridium sp.]SCK01869.1 Hyaluronoglucosaminidase precursor [uncultured Clostridium sp.]
MRLNGGSKKTLSLILTFTVMLANSTSLVRAEEISSYTNASVDNEKIIIGNDHITREFSIINEKISTSKIINTRANTLLIPQSGSEDFIINTVKTNNEPTPEPETTIPVEVIDRTNWRATLTNNVGTAYSEADVAKLFDGDNSTYVDKYQITGYPTSLVIDLGEQQKVASFGYQKRPGYQDLAYGKNGTMGKYKIYVSNDGELWNEAGNGEFTAEDYNLHQVDGLHNVGDTVYANLDRPYETRYVKIDQLSDVLGGTQEYTAAEVNLFSDEYKVPEKVEVPEDKTDIKASDLEIDKEGTIVEDIDNGKKVNISYKPYDLHGITYEIDMIVILENNDHYMRSFLEIKTDNKKAQIDYIDMDNFVLSNDIIDTVWSHPDLQDVSSMWIGKNELMLGQPIYANGMFFGSEFPATDTDMIKNEMRIRYYSGKTFEQLQNDNQLTVDGKFVSWQNVIGSAKGIDTDVVQTDFFEYISEIATPTEFRKQYNSWYDNMMGITDESIAKSFYGTEKGLTENGVDPVDSYVVDDGWNNYRDEEFNPNIGSNESGTGYNRTGFWEFNSKFPNELYTSAELVNKFQSKFGVWVGPQGGYNFFSGFGRYLEKMGTGYAQNDYWTNVCVGSDKYVKNLTSMFIDYQERFDVDYWKIDGFAVRPCTNSAHDHMTGGTNNMYYTTDLWEKWTDAWDAMRANRSEEGKGLFINATCYVNLSPWLLQWVNTIWVQDSGDTGEAGTGSRYQQKLTYRDNVYYNLYKVNQVQFPLKNIYNHDPIYGVSDGSNATTEDFRDFLFVNAVRGTAFWELYYSPSIMNDEKWQVNADVLNFAEQNFHILEKAKLFGNRPTEGVYGYSCWDGNEGIVAFRNPTGSEQTYTLQLTDIVGVPRTVENLKGNQVLPYVVGDAGMVSYGDSVTVTLAPYESKIIQYGNTDVEAPVVISAKVTGDNEITIKYNERIENSDGVYTVKNNNVTSATLLEDYRTLLINTEDKLVDSVVLNIGGERDSVENVLTTSLTIPVYENGNVIAGITSEDLINGESVTERYNSTLDEYLLEMNGAYELNSNISYTGKNDFAINMAIKTESINVNLIKQGDDIELSIDENGYLTFKVKDLSVSSMTEVTTVVEKAHGKLGTDEYVPTSTNATVIGKVNDGNLHNIIAVREVNGMLKIYIDGELMNSVYDESLVNQEIEAGKVVIADDNFDGVIGALELRNSSIYYDEVREINSGYTDNTVIEYNREKWNAYACSEMSASTGDGNANCAIDGNEDSWWHTSYVGGDNHEGNHWIAVNFGEEIEFDSVNLLSRGQGSNGTIKGYKLEAKIDGEWTVVKEGELTNGVYDSIELDEAITTSEIRITKLSTFNGQNFAAIKEITVTKKDRTATSEEIEAIKALIQEINANDYTAATAKRYLDVAKKINSLDSIIITKLQALRSELEAAYEGLLEARELNNLLNNVKDLNDGDYTTETWEVFRAALVNANRVVNSLECTSEDVANALSELTVAYEGLEEITFINSTFEITAPEEAKAGETINVQVAINDIMEGVNATEANITISYDKSILELNEITGLREDVTLEPGEPVNGVVSVTISATSIEAGVNFLNVEFTSKSKAEATPIVVDGTLSYGNKVSDITSKTVVIKVISENASEIFVEHLQIAVNMAEAITEEELEDVVPAVKNEFLAALEEAKTILGKFNSGEDISQAVINKSFDRLAKALHMLEYKGNKEALVDLVEEINGLNKDNYTTESWNNLQTVLNSSLVKDVLEDKNASQADIEKAYVTLLEAFTNLKEVEEVVIDKSKLEELINKVNKLDKNDYISTTWDKLEKVLKEAQKVFDDKNVTQEEVNKAYDGLMRAYLELRLKPNKDLLEDLINKAENLNKDDYTKESWNKLQEQLITAKAILANNDVTEVEVNNATKKLEIAINSLVVADKDSTNSNNNGSGNSSNNLPQTGGTPAAAVGLFGLVAVAAGAVIYKKKKN